MDIFTTPFNPFPDDLFAKKCRVCFSLTTSAKVEMLKIFDDEQNFGAQIYLLFGVQIVETSTSPALICSHCVKVLKSSMDLRKKCRDVDVAFRKMQWSYEEVNWSKNLESLGAASQHEDLTDFSDVQCKVEIDDVDDGETEIFEDFFNSPSPPEQIKQPKMPKPSKPRTILRQNRALEPENSKCEICQKTLASRKGLRRHMARIHQEKLEKPKRVKKEQNGTFICDYCGIVKLTRSKIYDHVKWHSGQALRNLRSFGPCSHCGKFFKTNGELIKHEVIHKPMSERQFWYCDLCGHRFKHRGGLFAHIRNRHIEKIRFYCPQCPTVSFATKYALKQHVDFKHLNIRKHVCEYCGKGFPKRCKLVDHVRIHTGEKPFACRFCEKRFTHQTDHMRHEWAHTGTRKYTCNMCRRSYDSKAELEVHNCPWKY